METKNYIFEEWKPIKGYEGFYEVSNFGRIKSKERNGTKGGIKKQGLCCGYYNVGLSKDGIMKTFFVHRLVAQAFLPNPNNYPCVNHKDNNRTNNNIDNLEWCTYKYNNTYGDRIEKTKNKETNKQGSKKVKCIETNEIFPSLHEIERKLGFLTSSICACCNGKAKTAYGYHWNYID